MGGFAALATTVGSHAHHSITGQYDPRAAVTVKGIVLEVRIRNPHSQMRLEVVDAAGRTEVWALEMDDVADLAEQGVTSKTLRAGDKLVIFVRTMLAATLEEERKKIYQKGEAAGLHRAPVNNACPNA